MKSASCHPNQHWWFCNFPCCYGQKYYNKCWYQTFLLMTCEHRWKKIGYLPTSSPLMILTMKTSVKLYINSRTKFDQCVLMILVRYLCLSLIKTEHLWLSRKADCLYLEWWNVKIVPCLSARGHIAPMIDVANDIYWDSAVDIYERWSLFNHVEMSGITLEN